MLIHGFPPVEFSCRARQTGFYFWVLKRAHTTSLGALPVRAVSKGNPGEIWVDTDLFLWWWLSGSISLILQSHILELSKGMPLTKFHGGSPSAVGEEATTRVLPMLVPFCEKPPHLLDLLSRQILGFNLELLVICVFLCWSGEPASCSHLLLMGKKYQRWIVQESGTSSAATHTRSAYLKAREELILHK